MRHLFLGQDGKLGLKLALFCAGLALNFLGAQLPGLLGLPLFLDNIGTFFVVSLIGAVPGMAVSYLGNVFFSFQQPEWLYWGLFGVIMASLAGQAAAEGKFTRLRDMLKLVPVFVVFTGLMGEFFSWVLYDFDMTAGSIGALAGELEGYLPLSLPLLRIVVCCVIEAADKSLTLALAFVLIGLARRFLPGHTASHEVSHMSPLRRRMVLLIMLSAAITGIVVFLLACYSHYHAVLAMGEAASSWEAFRRSVAFGGGLFSAMLGAEICIVGFSISYIDWTLVEPVRRMTQAMHNFVHEKDGKYRDAGAVTGLKIETDDELYTLQKAMSTAARDVVSYFKALNLKMEEIRNLHMNVITTVADIIENRDMTTGTHVKRTSAYAGIIAIQLREDGAYQDIINDKFIQDIEIAAPMHDVGKVCIPDSVLSKPGRLTDDEFETMKAHTTLGAKIIDKAIASIGSGEYLLMARDLANSHHEWWNGKGYPNHLQGQEIPLAARIMAIADVYDALTTARPYKRAFTPEEARDIIAMKEMGTHFEPVVVEAFVHAFDKIEKMRKQIQE